MSFFGGYQVQKYTETQRKEDVKGRNKHTAIDSAEVGRMVEVLKDREGLLASL